MKKEYQFHATIHSVPDKGGAYVIFPYNLREECGRGRLKVHATFDGEPYDGSIVNMGLKDDEGNVCYIIGIQKKIRQKIGKNAGDIVEVVLYPREEEKNINDLL